MAPAVEHVAREDGTPICDVAPIDAADGLRFAAGLIQYVEARSEAHARHAASGLLDHAFPLKRLDHLAAMAPDLEAATRFWSEALSVAVHGEVRGPGIIIRQLKMGDAILELLGPDGSDSRLAARPPGLSSMCAFEVADLDAAVALARERGFTRRSQTRASFRARALQRSPAANSAGWGYSCWNTYRRDRIRRPRPA